MWGWIENLVMLEIIKEIQVNLVRSQMDRICKGILKAK